MADIKTLFSSLTVLISTNFIIVRGLEYCEGDYWCEDGHCCGHGRCCTYYYEVWWFWLIWLAIALIVGCCFYQQKRLRYHRQRLLQLRARAEAQAEAEEPPTFTLPPTGTISQTGPQAFGAQHLYGPPTGPGKDIRLPTYDEIQGLPKDPPPYEALPESLDVNPQATGTLQPPPSSQTSVDLPSYTTTVPSGDQNASTASRQRDVENRPANVNESDNAGLLDNEVEVDMTGVPT